MAASPYIRTTDRLTTRQRLEIAEDAEARVMATCQMYSVGTPERKKEEARLDHLSRRVDQLQSQLAQEETASAGDGGLTNLVRFTRPS
jgi:hypothetical protein